MGAVRREGSCLKLGGPVHMSNVPALLAEASPLLGPDIDCIDLAEVTEVDSAAVSLLQEWQRQAARRGARLRFAHLPPALKSLAALYGVTDLLPEVE